MITIKQYEEDKGGKFLIFEKDNPAGEMTYRWEGKDKLIINHTGVFEEYRGKDYGRKLIMKGIEYAKEKGVKVVPQCSYVKKVMERDELLKDMIFTE
jgi:predicted GNAT family acetyltransferase